MSSKLKEILLGCSDRMLDAQLKPMIEKWDVEPTPIQILEVLDHAICSALAADVVITSLQVLYESACKKQNTTHEEVVKLAVWRR